MTCRYFYLAPGRLITEHALISVSGRATRYMVDFLHAQVNYCVLVLSSLIDWSLLLAGRSVSNKLILLSEARNFTMASLVITRLDDLRA